MKLKKFFLRSNILSAKYLILSFLIICPNISFGLTLMNSVQEAYLSNPKLNAERANVKAASFDKKSALSEFKPSITVSGYISQQDNEKGSESNFKPSEQSILIEQKIFQGFGGLANLKKENYDYQISKFNLKKIEQEILLSAIDAHTNVLLSMEKININSLNVDLLEKQVETDQARLETGEITLTDLSQSEASLAGARAKLISAENDLIISKSNYEKIVGKVLSSEIIEIGEINLSLPNSLLEAYRISKEENPDLKIAFLENEKAKEEVNIARSDLAPSATLSYKLSEQDDVSTTVKERKQQTLKATATWPLYSGGSNISSLKKSKEIKNQKELLLIDANKSVNTSVANAWTNFQLTESVLNSIRLQVKASEIANEGITLEYESGTSRSTLEVIQSNGILLSSRIDLAVSKRNFLISKFNLLSAIGRLTADQLGLKN
ncbi:MAG: hypothetical protein CBC24_00215 [Candidatus Pelagibacter sp. TMED64]|nr:hypothetical protein [Candidatus Pelagibacter sp.]OUU67895.1 MAG: hypothetical protein CBC24_00215 [Candidatus Pelagibacter sp. TMED64]|tara:strand:+ start:15310 stop:16620 length:1311 start_codon:yes stop_codon:yes gene_type:complete